jgi:hypothetical protein
MNDSGFCAVISTKSSARVKKHKNKGLPSMRCLLQIILLLTCALFFGCKVDNLEDRHATSSEKPSGAPEGYFSISGRILKGIVHGATVSVHPFIAGSYVAEPVAQTSSDSEGFYSIYVPESYIGRPALIKVSAVQGNMKCDLPDGCVDGEFGSWVPLSDNSFILNVGVPELRHEGIYNGTVLTHLGFVLAEADFNQKSDLENGLSAINLRMRLLSANSRVASAFGVVGDLPSHSVVDITDAEERRHAKAAVLEYSMLNGAVVGLAQTIYSENNYSDAIQKLALQFVTAGMPGSSPEGSEVSMIALNDSLIRMYRRFSESSQQSYTEELSGLYALRSLHLNDTANQYFQGVSSDSSNLTYLEKARRLVESVREIALSLDLRKLVQISNLSGFISGDNSGILEGFGVVVDTSQILQGERSEKTLAALGIVLRTALDTLILHHQGKPVPAEVNNVRVLHTLTGRQHTIVMQDDVKVCDGPSAECLVPVDLVVSAQMASLGGSGTVSLLEIRGLNADVVGVIGDAAYRLILPGIGSYINVDWMALQEGTDEFAGQTLVDLEGWEVSLPFQVISVDSDQETSLMGVLDSTGEKLKSVLVQQEQLTSETEASTEYTFTESIELYELRRFNLSTSFAINATRNDDFFAAFNLIQGNTPFDGKAIYSTSTKKLCGLPAGNSCTYEDGSSKIEGETNESFVRLSASVAYKANLKAIRSPVLIRMSGSRISPIENNIGSLKVNHPGHAIELNGRFNNGGGITALDAVNLDGMHLYFESINGKRAGAVETPSKEKVADIVDMGQWVKVQYLNGDFESF